MSNYDCALFLKIHKLQKSLRKAYKVKTSFTGNLGKGTKVPNWTNLIQWLQAFYHREARAYILKPSDAKASQQPDLLVVGTMFEVVKDMRDKP